ncbi:flagellar hook-length control protein FliK [Algiphilus sp.]|uniref:flagellar hook-length control protein FliK n=1 Tax=Algiphilus sp. TaxID=1872431 RepID=UPI003B515AFE
MTQVSMPPAGPGAAGAVRRGPENALAILSGDREGFAHALGQLQEKVTSEPRDAAGTTKRNAAPLPEEAEERSTTPAPAQSEPERPETPLARDASDVKREGTATPMVTKHSEEPEADSDQEGAAVLVIDGATRPAPPTTDAESPGKGLVAVADTSAQSADAEGERPMVTARVDADAAVAASSAPATAASATQESKQAATETVPAAGTVRAQRATAVNDGAAPASAAKPATNTEARFVPADVGLLAKGSEATGGSPREARGWSAAERFLSQASMGSAEAGKSIAASKAEAPALPRALVRELEQVLSARSASGPARLLTEAASGAATTPGVAPVATPGLATAAAATALPAGGVPPGSPPLPTAAPQQMAEMAARVLVDAASEGNWRVSLRLDPPDIGRLDVQIAREQGALTAHFVASTPAARAAMEQAMPMLQAQMAEQGMSLADSSVSQERSGQSSNGRDGEPGAGSNSAASEGAGEPLVTNAATVRRAQGLFEGWA